MKKVLIQTSSKSPEINFSLIIYEKMHLLSLSTIALKSLGLVPTILEIAFWKVLRLKSKIFHENSAKNVNKSHTQAGRAGKQTFFEISTSTLWFNTPRGHCVYNLKAKSKIFSKILAAISGY